jgi:hypothetical protein
VRRVSSHRFNVLVESFDILAKLSIGRFDVIFLDDSDPNGTALVLDRATSLPSCKAEIANLR